MRYATNDLLVAAGVQIAVAPVCTQKDTTVTCSGTTTSGASITVVSPRDDTANLTVTVGDQTLYSGSIQDVLDRAMLPSETP